MFNAEKFVADCKIAVGEGQKAVREPVAAAVSDPHAVVDALGTPKQAGVVPLYRSAELTVINFAWAPHMSLMPHNHEMFAVIGIYHGREDNVFWRRTDTAIEAAGAKSLGTGDVATLGPNVIHSVINPIGKMTTALHVYGGDFFAPPTPRREWDHETLEERPFNMDNVRAIFSAADARAKMSVGH